MVTVRGRWARRAPRRTAWLLPSTWGRLERRTRLHPCSVVPGDGVQPGCGRTSVRIGRSPRLAIACGWRRLRWDPSQVGQSVEQPRSNEWGEEHPHRERDRSEPHLARGSKQGAATGCRCPNRCNTTAGSRKVQSKIERHPPELASRNPHCDYADACRARPLGAGIRVVSHGCSPPLHRACRAAHQHARFQG